MAVRRKKKPRTKKSGAKGGRPAYEFDDDALAQLEVLARAANTIDDISAVLGVSKRTLERRIRWDEKVDAEEQDPVARVYHESLAQRRNNLRVAQYKLALGDPVEELKPSPTMLIWLGKQDLGQRDYKRLEVTGPAGGPLAIDTELIPELKQKLDEFLKNKQGKKPDASDERGGT